MPSASPTDPASPGRLAHAPASRFHPAPTALAVAVLLLAMAGAVHAQQAAATPPASAGEVRAWRIPAGSLDTALDRFARQAGVNLSYDPSLLAGARTAGLDGQRALAVPAALAALLAGTGLEAVPQAGGYSLRRAAGGPAPAGADAGAPGGAALPTVTVTGSADALGAGLPPAFAGGQVARGSRLGMLGNADLFETPFSTKAYTAELIRNQGARNVNDMVANDPSIRTSLSATSPLDQSSIRGFLTNSDAYLFDGLEGLFAYSNIPIQHYERLEVLKGPAAGLIGASGYGSTVGGSFNLVPKRATDAPVRSLTLSANDRSLLGAHVDLGQRFGEGGRWGVRVNASAENGRVYDDADRQMAAAQVAIDYRGERVRAVLDAGYTQRRSSPLFNHWLLAAGQPLPPVPDPGVHPKPSWEILEVRQPFGVISAEWDFADQWTAYARWGKLRESAPERRYVDQTTINGLGQVSYTSASSLTWVQANQVGEAGVRGRFQWGATRHQVSLSAVSQRQELLDLRSQSRALPWRVTGSIYTTNLVPSPYAFGVPPMVGVDSPALDLDSIALADTVSALDDRLFVTLAARQQRIKKLPYDQSKLTPTVAALYKFDGGVSVYANYAQSLAQGAVAPAGSRNAGEQLPPYLSRQHEIGLKWDRGDWGLTAAYFDIRKASAYVDSDNVFRAAGLQRNKGFEIEAFGEIARGTRLLGGVAWVDARMSRTAGGTADGRKAIGVPEFTANIGLEHDLAALPGLTLTGRFIHTGDAFVDLANTQRVPSWRRVDIGARYATRVGGTAMTLRAGINNLFDRHYWTIAGRNFISVAPPRTWQLSASFDF